MAETRYEYNPDYAVPPGEILQERLDMKKMSQAELARRCDRSTKLISEIISGKAPIEANTALELEKVLGLKAEIWVKIDREYRLFNARKEVREANSQNLNWCKNFPLKEMASFGLIEDQKNLDTSLIDLFSFFGVASKSAWQTKYASENIAFRHSETFDSNLYAIRVWLRIGEKIAEDLWLPEYQETEFRKAVHKIRTLTSAPFDDALEQATRLCNDAGVTFSVSKPFESMKLHGAAWWLSPKSPIIQLTARHMTDDQFWFSFFHEAAHILLHAKRNVFLDDTSSNCDDEETEANRWAENILIPKSAWTSFSKTLPKSKVQVLKFANEQNIAPGIIVGRLQREGIIPYSNLNKLKVPLTWTKD